MVTRGRTRGSKNTNGTIRDSVLLAKSLHPNWSASQVRNYLMRNKPTGKSIIPKLRTIQNILADGKPNLDAVSQSGLDKPWHLGLMREPEYIIPPEVVPDILAVQEWCAREHPDVPLFVSEPLTIRQALWIARLYGITRLLRAGKVKGMNKNLDLNLWLWQCSKAYAQHEIICDLSGSTTFDTSKLDNAIWSGATPLSADNAIDLFFPDNHIETIIEKRGEK